ncbi:hypothetical protein [Deinococcus indicus]|nr:hypothetical protein [Deinococcus indicus]
MAATLVPGTYTLSMTVTGNFKRVAGAWVDGPVDVWPCTSNHTV